MSYESKPDGNEDLRSRIIELAQIRKRFGYRRIHALLRREGIEVNSKRVYRLYTEENLSVRRRKRKKGIAVERDPLMLPDTANEVWSMDFVMDRLANGNRLKLLTIVDDYTKESVDIVADRSITGDDVAGILDKICRFRGFPESIRTDQGPEFTSRALDAWAYRNGVKLKLIQPGKPTQNAFIESFNGKFRDECLNDHWFNNMTEARAIIAAWRQDYNERRPHSSLGYMTPGEWAAKHRTKVRNTEKEEMK